MSAALYVNPAYALPEVPGDSYHVVCGRFPTRTLCGFRLGDDCELVDDDEPTGCIVCDELNDADTCVICGGDDCGER